MRIESTVLTIDETCLSRDELYAIVTNKAFKGKKGALLSWSTVPKLKCFNTVLQTFMNNYQTILNYSDNRLTNGIMRK